MRPWSQRQHHTTLFFACFWVFLVAVGRTRMFRDPGTFWHIVAGERVLTHWLPRSDWLTFTFAGQPWIAHQWLAECLMAVLHRIGGFDALLIATSGAIALVFSWGFLMLLRAGITARWSAVLACFAALTSVGHLHVRPIVLSIAFFAATFGVLVSVERRWSRIGTLWWLPPLFVLWTNCHGAVLGGIGTMLLVCAGWVAAWLLRRSSPVESTRGALVVAAVGATSCLSVFANPYGIDTVRAWVTILRSRAIADTILEHASVVRAGAYYVVPFCAAYLAIAVTSDRSRWGGTFFASLAWLVLMFDRVRHAPMFAIAALMCASDFVPTSAVTSWLARRGVHVLAEPGSGRSMSVRLPGALPCAVVLALALTCTWPHARRGAALVRLDGGWWPTSLVPDLRRVQQELGAGAPILNDTFFGGFIEFYAPGLRVFSDDRCELFGDDFIEHDAAGDQTWLSRWVTSRGVVVALAQRNSRLHQYLSGSGEWREIATSEPAVLFRRMPP